MPNNFLPLTQIIRQNKLYFILLLIYFVTGAWMLIAFGKETVILFLNRNHRLMLDYFFKYVTYLGDGIFAVPFILFVLLYRSRLQGIILAASVGVTFIVVHILKWFVYPEMPRPSRFFPESMKLYYVKGVDIHSYNSFPSGHSAQAFAIFMLIAIFSKNKYLGALFFFLALLTTFSRMYLMQHFFIDTYFGALIATVITFFTYYYFMTHTGLPANERMQKGWLTK